MIILVKEYDYNRMYLRNSNILYKKKILDILLFPLFLDLSVTAQNAFTIQQLLDEDVTVGELLYAGVSVDGYKLFEDLQS